MSIHYQIIGKGKPIVLLHGWAFHSGIWAKLVAAAQEHYQLHLIDMPGFGLSQRLIFSSSLQENIKLLLPYLPPKAAYLGWSMGGLLALQVALSYPDRVSHLLLVNSTPCFVEKVTWQGVSFAEWQRFYHQVSEYPTKALKSFILSGLASTTTQKHHYQTLQQQLIDYGLAQKNSLLNGLTALAKTDLSNNLSEVNCPTAFCIGDTDHLTPNNHLPATKLVKNAGHFLPWTDTDIVIEWISDYL